MTLFSVSKVSNRCPLDWTACVIQSEFQEIRGLQKDLIKPIHIPSAALTTETVARGV